MNRKIIGNTVGTNINPKKVIEMGAGGTPSSAIINSSSGKTILLTDSANAPIKGLQAQGESSQKQYEGKNLIPYPYADTTKTVNGITFTDNGDGTITANGTSTGNADFVLANAFNIKTGMTISGSDYSMASSYLIQAYLDNANYIQTRSDTFTSKTDFTTWIRIRVYSGATLNNVTFKPQLEYGSEATEYEPYVGNAPSPSMEYPQEVENLENVEVKVFGKNLWDKEYASNLDNWLKRENPYYKRIPVYVGKGNVVTISYSELPLGISNLYVCITLTDAYDYQKQYWIYHPTNSDNLNPITTVTATEDYIYVWCLDDGIRMFVENLCDILQIELGTVATEYEPYTEQTFTINTPVPLTKWDKLVNREGVWGVSVYHVHLVVDGNSNISKWQEFYIPYALPHNMLYRDGFCNGLIVGVVGNYADATLWLGANNDFVYFPNNPYWDESLADKGLANFKAYLSENPLEIWTYADTEQDFIPLAEEEQDKIKSVMMNYPTTTILSNAELEVEYVADTKNYIDNKIKELASAVAQLL